ncbi:(dimethylallyl)adenosine tRNA methylthiotransferase [Anopheles sinensis]|uniref:(Dimethylallyl)adenosine tRNA methylthiotransferase n=1 Tax=Anopheles sinensis TaxID=74873 RepID=A0A084VEK7_ANOSI|nr:(dimethylallyl)adenosine tRNA methylthiotransferase [Anopheles sinensis]
MLPSSAPSRFGFSFVVTHSRRLGTPATNQPITPGNLPKAIRAEFGTERRRRTEQENLQPRVN